jgi:hypothetical protein
MPGKYFLPPTFVFSERLLSLKEVNLVKLSPEDIAIPRGERVRPQLNRDEASVDKRGIRG